MIFYNSHISKEDPLYKFHFEEYHSDSNIKLHLGYNPLITLSKRLGEYHILLDLEQPNSFLHPATNKSTVVCEEFFDKILTVEKKYELLISFNKVRREFRNEKLLIFFILHFLFVSSDFSLENISFM